MPRFILALAFCCVALHATGASPAEAGANELSAAQSACARLKQTTQDEKTLTRINAAAENLAAEAKRRQAKH